MKTREELLGFDGLGEDLYRFEEMGFEEMGFEGLVDGEKVWTSDLAEQFAQQLGRIEEADGAGGSGVGKEGVEEWEKTSEEEGNESRETAGGEGEMEEEGGAVETRMKTNERLAMEMGPSDRYFQLPSTNNSPHESSPLNQGRENLKTEGVERQQGGWTISEGENGHGTCMMAIQSSHQAVPYQAAQLAPFGPSSSQWHQQGQQGKQGQPGQQGQQGQQDHQGQPGQRGQQGQLGQQGQQGRGAGVVAGVAAGGPSVSWGFSVEVSGGFMTPGEDGSLQEAKEGVEVEVEVPNMAGSALSVLPSWHADMMQCAVGMMSSFAPHQRDDRGKRYAFTMSRRSSVVVIPNVHQHHPNQQQQWQQQQGQEQQHGQHHMEQQRQQQQQEQGQQEGQKEWYQQLLQQQHGLQRQQEGHQKWQQQQQQQQQQKEEEEGQEQPQGQDQQQVLKQWQQRQQQQIVHEDTFRSHTLVLERDDTYSKLSSPFWSDPQPKPHFKHRSKPSPLVPRSYTVSFPLEPPVVSPLTPESQHSVGTTGGVGGGSSAIGAGIAGGMGVVGPMCIVASAGFNVGSGNGVNCAGKAAVGVAGGAAAVAPAGGVDGVAVVAGGAGVSGIAGLASSPACSPSPISSIPLHRVRRSQSHDQGPMGAGQPSRQMLRTSTIEKQPWLPARRYGQGVLQHGRLEGQQRLSLDDRWMAQQQKQQQQQQQQQSLSFSIQQQQLQLVHQQEELQLLHQHQEQLNRLQFHLPFRSQSTPPMTHAALTSSALTSTPGFAGDVASGAAAGVAAAAAAAGAASVAASGAGAEDAVSHSHRVPPSR
ncbi:unnamed protein product [Closterium sp. NIES-53]